MSKQVERITFLGPIYSYIRSMAGRKPRSEEVVELIYAIEERIREVYRDHIAEDCEIEVEDCAEFLVARMRRLHGLGRAGDASAKAWCVTLADLNGHSKAPWKWMDDAVEKILLNSRRARA